MTQHVRGTRAQHLRNNYIRGKYPRLKSDGLLTFSPEPESPDIVSLHTMSPTLHYNWTNSVGKYPRQRKNGTWTFSELDTVPSSISPSISPYYTWMVPAAGAAAAGTTFSTKHHKKKQSHHASKHLVVSPVSRPMSTSLTHGPQGHLVDMSSPTSTSTSTSSKMGAGTGLLIGTFAAATLAARRKAKSQKKK